MKGMIKNWRCWILGILAVAALICFVSEVSDESDDWLRDFALIKLTGCVIAATTRRLYRYWSARGKMTKIENYINEY